MRAGKFPRAAGLETWPLSVHQKEVGAYSQEGAKIMARRLRDLLSDNQTSCRPRELDRDPLIQDLVSAKILLQVFTDSGAWYLKFTPYTKSWTEHILTEKS